MMMKPNDVLYGTILLLLLAAVKLQAQVYQSYKSETYFFSKAPLEDIDGHKDGGARVLNTGTQEIVFVIHIRGRSEESRGGNEYCSTCTTHVCTQHYHKKKITT